MSAFLRSLAFCMYVPRTACTEPEAGSWPEPSGNPWYLAYTKPKQEYVAQINLERQRFEVYLPMYREIDGSVDGIRERHTPMFARYLFFRATGLNQSLSPVSSTRGVSKIVQFGFEFATVASEVIDAIRQLEAERNELPVHQLKEWRIGSTVRFRTSALQGLEGIVNAVNKTRIEILMEFMGRHQRILVPHDVVAPA